MNNQLFALDLIKQHHHELREQARHDRLARESGFRPLWKRIADRLTRGAAHTGRGRRGETKIAV